MAASATSATSLTGTISAANIPPDTITGAMIADGTVIPNQIVSVGGLTAAANASYVATIPTTFTLPTAANVGDIVQVTGANSSGEWHIVPGTGQTFYAPWVPRETNRNWSAIASSYDGAKLAAVVYDGQIYTSTDSGMSWVPRETNRAWSAITSSYDGDKLAAVVYGGQIYTSTDSGVSWTPRDSSRAWYSITSSSDGATLAAVVYGGDIYTSNDYGVTWTAQLNGGNWISVTASGDGSKLAAAAQGGQIHTRDASPPAGGQGDSVTLTYLGGGQWQMVTDTALGTKVDNLTTALAGNFARLSTMQTFPGANTFSNAANSFTGSGAGLPGSMPGIWPQGPCPTHASAPTWPCATPPIPSAPISLSMAGSAS